VDTPHFLEFEPAQRKLYDKMKRDMIAALPEGIITAANSAACYSKLSQMANGGVYVNDDKSLVSVIHDLKLDAIEDLLEELNGEPLLVAYEFNHDLERLRERFGVDDGTGKLVIPYLGKGTTAAQEALWIGMWNRGELPLLCAHPASAGHGLNMQGASAANVAWFGITWDYELYDQFIRRIRRDGSNAVQVFNHLLLVRDTIDELKFAALGAKEMSQSGLLKALNTEIRRSAETLAAQGDAAPRRLEPVAIKLSRPGAATAQPSEAAPAEGKRNLFSKPKEGAAAPVEAADDQRERIQSQLKGEDRASEARGAFSGRVAETRAGLQQEYGEGQETSNGVRTDPEPPKATRTRAPKAEDVTAPVINVDAKPTVNVTGGDNSLAVLVQARVDILKLAAESEPQSTEELFQMAEELWNWASSGEALKAALAPF
jgi:hypothetical protein